MTWGRFIYSMVKIAWNGPRNCSVRNIVIEWEQAIMRIPETELNSIPKYDAWVRRHSAFGKELVDALWFFLKREYEWP